MAKLILPTVEQVAIRRGHERADARGPQGPDELTDAQHEQMEHDLKLLLPVGYDGKDKLRSAKPRAAEEVPRLDAPLVKSPKLAVGLPGARLKYKAFPMGGWVEWGKPAWMQRVDQGQDFEIIWGRSIIAPGWGKVVSWLHDGPFPNGFGSPYMVVYIGGGRMAGHLWYLGHMNYVQMRPGETFKAGRALGRLYNSLNAGRGWIEVGNAANGYPGPMGTGARYHSLFASPEWRWTR